MFLRVFKNIVLRERRSLLRLLSLVFEIFLTVFLLLISGFDVQRMIKNFHHAQAPESTPGGYGQCRELAAGELPEKTGNCRESIFSACGAILIVQH